MILCEGFDAFIIREIAEELHQRQLDECNVSIVAVGGKDKLSRLAKLIVGLGISCYVVADFDYLIRDKHDDRKKYGDVPAHESILNLHLSVFSQSCMFGKHASSAISHLTKLRNAIKDSDERAFYTAKHRDQIDHAEIGKTLSIFRQNGICILDGQIENCCKDETFISPTKKLDLKRVYELKEKLTVGGKMSDIFDLTQFQPFFERVFRT